MAEVTRKRRGEIVRGVFEVLADEPEGLQVLEVIERVRELVPPTHFEAAEWPTHPGEQRYPKHLRFHTIPVVRAGWLVKEKGIWRLTAEGLEALGAYPDPKEFQKEAEQKYAEWAAQQPQDEEDPRWEIIGKILDTIPGAWTSYGDIGEVVGLNAQGVGWFMSHQLPHNGHRVLGSRGRISSNFHWADPETTDDPRDVLAAEGVRFDDGGRADQAQRLDAAQLRKRIGHPSLAQRAWLVRGSSVDGINLVPTWLEEGFSSLQAKHLVPVEAGIGRDALKAIVEDNYRAISYSARSDKVQEFHAFLSEMKTGDVVVTTAGGVVHIGAITGGATYLDSPGGRSNLRRDIEWDDAAHKVDEVPAALRST